MQRGLQQWPWRKTGRCKAAAWPVRDWSGLCTTAVPHSPHTDHRILRDPAVGQLLPRPHNLLLHVALR